MNGILALRPRALGDVVLMIPALRALKRGHPEVPLEVATEARYAALLEGLPEVDRVWALPHTTRSTMDVVGAWRRRRYAWTVDFFGNPRTALLTMLSGARRAAGFDLRGRRYAYRVRVARDAAAAGRDREHASTALLRLAAAAGGLPDGQPPRLVLRPAVRSEAKQVLDRAGIERPERTIGLVAAGTWPTKTWPASHAGLLARRLTEAGWEVLLLSGPGEERVVEVVARVAPKVRPLPACGVGVLVGVISHLGAVVGTDSGPRHVAAALEVPTYAWFGPTHPDTWQPPGDLHGFWRTSLPCRGCDRTECPHWSCLPSLSPDEAARRVLGHLDFAKGHARAASSVGPAAGA